MEGPDFTSIVGSEQATLREGLIAQGSSRSQSTLQWGKSHVVFSRNPFKELEKLNVIFERLTRVTDFACSAGHEYTALLTHFCEHKISNEVLQMLEDVQILGKPTFTTVILQCLTDHEQNTTHQGMNGIRQLLPALNDPRVCRLFEHMQPYFVDRISKYVRELQCTLLIQLDARNQWLAAAMDLLVFYCELQEQTWLLVHLDRSVQQFIASGPSLTTKIQTLGVVRKSVRSTTASTPTSLSSQIDAYCKTQLIPGGTTDPNFCRLVETLIYLWQQNPDENRRELALLIADLPNTGCQFRWDCLTDITTLSDFWIITTLRALLHDESPDLGCFALLRLLASEDEPVILERWRKVLSFAIEKQHETLLHHAVTHLTTDMWFKLLGRIRVVYKRSDVIGERLYPRLFNLELHKWSQQIADYIPTLMRLESVLKHGPAMQMLLLGSTSSNNCQLLRVLDFVENSKSIFHTKLMDIITALLHIRKVEVIEDVLSVVSEASSKGAEACLRVLDSRCHVSQEMTEVVLATNLRAGDISEPDRLALRKVSRFFGINLDAEGYPSEAILKEAAKRLCEQYLRLMMEARRLESLRLSLQAVTPERISELLVRLQIEAPSALDDALASLPSTLGSLVERLSKNEVELQFPATELTKLQRFAIGAEDAEIFLVRLTLGHDGKPVKFCVHLSAESSDQTNSKSSSNGKGHTSWGVFSSDRPPHEQYCNGRPNRGVYQLSRMLWHHLRYDFISLEQTHAHMTSKLSRFGQGCVVCGLGQRRLRRTTICPSLDCQRIFSQAHVEIQLAEIWQDPPVMDLLLSMVHATASTGKLDLLTNCPASDAFAVVSMVDALPAIPTLAKHLKYCLNVHGNKFRLAQALVGYCTQYVDAASLGPGLLWACISYRGFLVSATGPQRIPSFGSNQFLLANTAPDLELAFSRHMPTPQSPAQILFHGTSLDRLHAILCQGLRVQSGTALQRHGAAHGAGIYMADEPSLAWGYATATSGGWKSSKLKDMKLLLGCELAGPKPQAPYSGIYVITDATKLAVRYIFLLGTTATMPAAKDVRLPMASVFRSLRSGTL